MWKIFYFIKGISPFSISTGKTSIFSTLFSSSYSADAATGSTSSLRRSYSSLEKVLKTCVYQRHSFSGLLSLSLESKVSSASLILLATYRMSTDVVIFIYHGRRVTGNFFMYKNKTRNKRKNHAFLKSLFMMGIMELGNFCAAPQQQKFVTITESTNLLF